MRFRIRNAAAAMVWAVACAIAAVPPAQAQVAALDPRWELLGAPLRGTIFARGLGESVLLEFPTGAASPPIAWHLPADPARPPSPRATTGEAPAWGGRVVAYDALTDCIYYVGVARRARVLSLRDHVWRMGYVGGLPPPVDLGAWSVAWDQSRRRWIVFGGGWCSSSFFGECTGTDATNRVWELIPRGDSLYWNELFPAGTPPAPRWLHAAAIETLGDRMIVFGGSVRPPGSPGWEPTNDLWVLRFSPALEWVQPAPSAPAPAPRLLSPLVVQESPPRIVLLPGLDDVPGEEPLWSLPLEFDATAPWQPLPAAGAPPGNRGLAAYDPATERVTYLGETGQDLLAANGTYGGRSELDLSGDAPVWRDLVPATPGPTAAGIAAYDFGRDQLHTMFTRSGGSALTPAKMMHWRADLRDPIAWAPVDSTAELAYREAFTLVHDPRRDRLVLFGGAVGPPASYGAPLPVTNDVWVRQLPDGAWTPLATGGAAPAPRARHVAVYDPTRDRMLVFGGESYGSPNPAERFGDLWELSLAGAPAWRRLDGSDPRPAPRAMAAAALDTTARRLYVHGGVGADTLADLWAFSLVDRTWSPVATSGPGPGALADHALAWDGRRSLLHALPSHVQRTPYASESLEVQPVWTLDLGAPGGPAWSAIEAPGIPPPAMGGRRAFVSRGLDALVLYQERMPIGYEQSRAWWSVHALRLGDGSATASAEVVRAWADDAGAHLRWRVAGSAASWMSVQRRTAGDAWRDLDLLDTGRWLVAVDDATVVPGWTYEYRLEIWKPLDPAYSPVARLVIPGGATTARAQFAPVRNPAPTGPRFRFLLAGAPEGTARVELFDVSGRREASVLIPIAGAGPYTVDFGRATGRPGVYLARLVVNGVEVATARVVAFID